MMIIFFANQSCNALGHSLGYALARARALGNCSVCEACPPAARDFVFFFSVKCHIQQLEKAVSILNIKKNEKCNKYPVLFNLPSQKKKMR